MAHATYSKGEKVLCYETDPGMVNKLYPAVVKQAIIVLLNSMLDLNIIIIG